jgi:hypothetical protein
LFSLANLHRRIAPRSADGLKAESRPTPFLPRLGLVMAPTASERPNVKIDYDFQKKPPRFRAVKGMIVQILENLTSNSIYWLEHRIAGVAKR